MTDNNKEKPEDFQSKLDKIIDDLGLDMGDDDSSNLISAQEFKSEILDGSEEGAQTKLLEKERAPAEEKKEEGEEIPIEELVELELEKKKSVIDPIHTPVYVSWKAYKRMVGYGMRYANDDSDMKNWREVYGILIGEVEEETLVVIKDAIPVCVGGKTGVELEPIHYVDLSQIDASVYERSIENEKTDFIIGWWHTHPGFGFFFSEVDSYTHLGYQIPNAFAVGLIFDHCEHKGDKLGVAGLRLTEPEEGFLSDYMEVDLHYDDEIEEYNRKIKKVIKKVKKNMDDVLDELEYIDKTLRRKALAQLQRNYGLILVPKRDVKLTEDEEEAEEEEDAIYVWDPEFFEKRYRIPKFREKIENTLKDYEQELKELYEKGEFKKFEDKKEKYRKKIKSKLEKPNEWYERLMDDFSQRLSKIFPFFDYLDTEERKIIEHFEERISEYSKVLENLNMRAEFKDLQNKKLEVNP